jgi:hypothetical protein
MPSSTSSSDRSTPQGRWPRALGVALLLAFLVVAGWEMRCRSMGYAPTLNDTGDLWAEARTELSRSAPDRTVIIGSSRVLFDFDLDVFAEHFGTTKPVQLALPGSKPLQVLEHLAADEAFRGTVLVGVVPGLYFAPQGPPVVNTEAALGRHRNWSPSQRAGHQLGKLAQKSLAFIQQEDLTLNALLKSLPVPVREATKPHLMPELPPYFAGMDDDRRARMWEQCDFDSPLAQRIQQIWIPLFTPPPPPPGVTPEAMMEQFMASVENDLRRTRESVDLIRGRGGRVVFIRCPSTGTLRQMENQFSPRPGFWERILAESAAPGIHFEDHPELSGFDCPEWSHLTAADATAFTRNLMPILERVLDGMDSAAGT